MRNYDASPPASAKAMRGEAQVLYVPPRSKLDGDDVADFVVYVGAGAAISQELREHVERVLDGAWQRVDIVASDTDAIAVLRGSYGAVSHKILELMSSNIDAGAASRPPAFVWPYEIRPIVTLASPPRHPSSISAYVDVTLEAAPSRSVREARIKRAGADIIARTHDALDLIAEVRGRNRLFLRFTADDIGRFNSVLSTIVKAPHVDYTQTFLVLKPEASGRTAPVLEQTKAPTKPVDSHAVRDLVFFIRGGAAVSHDFVQSLRARKTATGIFGASHVDADAVLGGEDAVVLVHGHNADAELKLFELASHSETFAARPGSRVHAVRPYVLTDPRRVRRPPLPANMVQAYMEVDVQADTGGLGEARRSIEQALRGHLEYIANIANRSRVFLRLRAHSLKEISNLALGALQGNDEARAVATRTYIVAREGAGTSYGGNVDFVLRTLAAHGGWMSRSALREACDHAELDWHAVSTGALKRLLKRKTIERRGKAPYETYRLRPV